MPGKKRFRVLVLAVSIVLLLIAVPLAYGDGTVPAEASDVSEVVSGYDLNGNCIIDRDEVFQAADDYFAAEISVGDVIAIINFYFSEEPVRTAGTADLQSDRESLIALYNSTGGLNWVSDSGWLTDSPVGQWHGVTTNPLRASIRTGLAQQPVERANTGGVWRLDQPGKSGNGP